MKPWCDVALLTLGALLVYGVLAQQTMYGDGTVLLMKASAGDIQHPNHFLYLPLLVPFAKLLAPLCTLHEAAVWFSSIGAALGVGAVHGASWMLLRSRVAAAGVAVLVALLPALVFFATLVELHGPFFACFGLSALAFAHSCRRPSVFAVVLLGLTTALSYLAHATGHLLVGLYCLWWAGRAVDQASKGAGTGEGRAAESGHHRRRLLVPVVKHGVVLVVTHLVLVFASTKALQVLGYAIGTDHNASAFAMYFSASTARPWLFFVTAWQEWLLPCAPLSLAWLVGLRNLPGTTMAFALACLAYMLFAFFVLADHPEHGAYLLPLAWPAAMLVVSGVGARAVLGLAAISFVLAVFLVKSHDDPERSRAYAAGLEKASGGTRPFLLVAFYLQDMEANFVRGLSTKADLFEVSGLTHVPDDQMPAAVLLMEQQIRQLHAAGRKVFLTAEAEAHLGTSFASNKRPSIVQVRTLLLEQMEAVPVHVDGFMAKQIRPR